MTCKSCENVLRHLRQHTRQVAGLGGDEQLLAAQTLARQRHQRLANGCLRAAAAVVARGVDDVPASGDAFEERGDHLFNDVDDHGGLTLG